MSEREMARLFQDVVRRFQQSATIPLNVVVCGPGAPDSPDPGHPFHLREAIKEHLKSRGDNAFYIEDLLTGNDLGRLEQQIESRIGYKPTLREIEYFIMESPETEKDVHLLEKPGAILELRDFEDSPIICQKMKIFIDSRYRDSDSYIKSTVIRNVQEKGAKVHWYDSMEDLKEKVARALVPNRVRKSRLRY